MLEPWMAFTVCAAFFQNARSALQKHLHSQLSTAGASYARFIYALPFVTLYLLLLLASGKHTLPEPNPQFFLYCLIGGVSQILFTVCLLWMFTFQSFAVGTTFSKLEVIFVAVLSSLVLGDALSFWAVLAIAAAAFGIVALSLGQNRLSVRGAAAGLLQRSTFIGLLCALLLGASSVFFRGASLALGHDDLIIAAAWTLFVSLAIQTTLMGLFLGLRNARELIDLLAQWRWGITAGMAGAGASICWFIAFTIQNASYVRALGQIELIFTFAVTTLIFRERVSRMETIGIIMVGSGIVMLILAI